MGMIQSSLILSFARLTNYVVMLATPLLLVRLLDMEAYGQYREFILYSSVLISFFVLAIKENLIYFIPRYPEKADIATSQSIGMLVVTSVIGSIIFLAGSDWFMAKASYDFAMPLLVYVFFFINFDVIENYWLAIQEPKKVLFFSTLRVFFRVMVVLVTAFAFRDLWSILYSIIGFEIVKSAICIALVLKNRLVTLRIDHTLLKEQLRFIVPLSAASLIYLVNEKAGQLYLSAEMGAAALALYTVGTYQLPITSVVRSAIADTLFPEMVKHAASGSQEGLALWRTANTYYCFLVFPVFAVMFVYAELIIVTLFTATYREAADIFRVALLVMIRQCFEMGTPLRAVNANKHMLAGNLLAIVFNLPLLYVLLNTIGIIGAAFAWLFTDVFLASYLARQIMKHYKIGIGGIANWGQLLKLTLAAGLGAPVLWVAERQFPDSIWLAMLSSSLFCGLYLLFVKRQKIDEIEKLLGRFMEMGRQLIRRKSQS